MQKRIADTDARTNLRLREIVQKYGWPAPDLVGLDGAAAAMTMVQHLPAGTQRQVLPAVEAAFHAGTVRGGEYANLLDHVLRAEVGLMSLADYRDLLRQMYFPKK